MLCTRVSCCSQSCQGQCRNLYWAGPGSSSCCRIVGCWLWCRRESVLCRSSSRRRMCNIGGHRVFPVCCKSICSSHLCNGQGSSRWHARLEHCGALVGNDIVIMLSWCNKMGLFLNSQKKCYIGQHFWFCRIWVTWQRCVICPQHMTADLWLILFFIFAIILNLLIPTKNTERNPQTPLLPNNILRGGATKKLATTDTMATDAAGHHGCNFSRNSPFWLLRLHQ